MTHQATEINDSHKAASPVATSDELFRQRRAGILLSVLATIGLALVWRAALVQGQVQPLAAAVCGAAVVVGLGLALGAQLRSGPAGEDTSQFSGRPRGLPVFWKAMPFAAAAAALASWQGVAHWSFRAPKSESPGVIAEVPLTLPSRSALGELERARQQTERFLDALVRGNWSTARMFIAGDFANRLSGLKLLSGEVNDDRSAGEVIEDALARLVIGSEKRPFALDISRHTPISAERALSRIHVARQIVFPTSTAAIIAGTMTGSQRIAQFSCRLVLEDDAWLVNTLEIHDAAESLSVEPPRVADDGFVARLAANDFLNHLSKGDLWTALSRADPDLRSRIYSNRQQPLAATVPDEWKTFFPRCANIFLATSPADAFSITADQTSGSVSIVTGVVVANKQRATFEVKLVNLSGQWHVFDLVLNADPSPLQEVGTSLQLDPDSTR